MRPAGAVLLVCLVGCTRTTDDSHWTVEYYREHVQERRAMLAECTNDRGFLERTPSCINAREAERIESIGSLRDRRPMALPLPDRSRPAGTRER